MPDNQLVTITVRAEGPGAPLEIRLRRALKWILRTHGLRCVRVQDVPPALASVPTLDAGNGRLRGEAGELHSCDTTGERE